MQDVRRRQRGSSRLGRMAPLPNVNRTTTTTLSPGSLLHRAPHFDLVVAYRCDITAPVRRYIAIREHVVVFIPPAFARWYKSSDVNV